MQHTMQVLDHTGHTEVRWDQDDPDSVKIAREAFDAMRAKGHRAFEAKKAQPGRRLDAFDPSVERMVFVPHVAGG